RSYREGGPCRASAPPSFRATCLLAGVSSLPTVLRHRFWEPGAAPPVGGAPVGRQLLPGGGGLRLRGCQLGLLATDPLADRRRGLRGPCPGRLQSRVEARDLVLQALLLLHQLQLSVLLGTQRHLEVPHLLVELEELGRVLDPA